MSDSENLRGEPFPDNGGDLVDNLEFCSAEELKAGNDILRQAKINLRLAKKAAKRSGDGGATSLYELSAKGFVTATEFLPDLSWKDHLRLMDAQGALAAMEIIPDDPKIGDEEIDTMITRKNRLVDNMETSFERAVLAAGGMEKAPPNILAKIYMKKAQINASLASSPSSEAAAENDLGNAINDVEGARSHIDQMSLVRKIAHPVLLSQVRMQSKDVRRLEQGLATIAT